MRVSTNVDGLDQILRGGLIPERAYLVHGAPGSGKTTLGLHFLSRQERALLVSFTEPEENLRAEAKLLGLNVEKVSFLDLTPIAETFAEPQGYDIFSPSEVEREPITQQIVTSITNIHPERIFVDGFHLFRQLAADDPFHYYRLAQSFFRFATKHHGTVLVASDEQDASSIVDGIIHLEYSRDGRAVRVAKFRGSDFHPGSHPMRLTSSGIQVLPNAA